MAPILSVLLCLALCLGQNTRTQADKAILVPDKGPLVPLGSRVTLSCQGSQGAALFRLQKGQGSKWRVIQDMVPSGGEGEFLIPSVTANEAGIYSCLYWNSSDWSETSDPLDLVVTGLYEPPSLTVWPSSQVTPGQQVTLQCLSQERVNWFALYKDGEDIGSLMVQPQGWGAQANFSLLAVTPAQGGSYQCYSFHSNSPYVLSVPSDPLVLRVPVAGTTKEPPVPSSSGNPQALTSSPPSPAPQDYTVGNLLCVSLAGLVLLILGVLLVEAWQSRRGPQDRAAAPPHTGSESQLSNRDGR